MHSLSARAKFLVFTIGLCIAGGYCELIYMIKLVKCGIRPKRGKKFEEREKISKRKYRKT